MGYNAPVTRATGYVVTSTDYNNIENNIAFLAGSAGASVTTNENTTSTSYTNLTTAGPAVTITTGANAIVMLAFQGSNGTAADGCLMSVAVSGATTVAASDNNSGVVIGSTIQSGVTIVTLTGLNAGANTFTAQYKALTGGTASFMRRNITVIPLP